MSFLSIYRARISVVFTGTPAANSAIWAMRASPTSRSLTIHTINVCAGFAGTTAATTGLYEFRRFSAADYTLGTGSVDVVAQKRVTTQAATSASSIRMADGSANVLGAGGVSVEEPFCTVGCPRVAGATNPFEFDFFVADSDWDNRVVLAPGEGLVVRLGAAAVAGDSITGFVEFFERA